MLKYAGAMVAVLALGGPAAAQEVVQHKEAGFVSYTIAANYSDVAFDMEDAITAEGLLLDWTGFVNKMLESTAEAVGAVAADGSKSPFTDSNYWHFCSGKLTHDAVDADPANVAICPYIVFAYATRAAPGMVTVGYRRPLALTDVSEKSTAALGKIEELLDRIVRRAAHL
jgi:hypothetical protein